MWFEHEDADQAARVTRFVFPVGCDYDSQEIRSVSPARLGGALAEDEHGNVTLSYGDEIPLDVQQPLLLGRSPMSCSQ